MSGLRWCESAPCNGGAPVNYYLLPLERNTPAHGRVRRASERSCPAEAGLRWLWRVHGSLNFVRKAIKVLVQSVVHFELGLVRCQVPDQGGVSCILAEFFD